jgi:IS6 family transposase
MKPMFEWRSMEVPVPSSGQAWRAHRFHAAGSSRYSSSVSFPEQSLENDATLAPHSITTDKLGSYPKAIHRLQREDKLGKDTKHRTSKYLNNIIEADHGGIKRVLLPTRGFQTMKTAYATIKSLEAMRMIRRRPCILCQPRVAGEVQFVNTLFGRAA